MFFRSFAHRGHNIPPEMWKIHRFSDGSIIFPQDCFPEDWLTRRKNLTTGMKSREISEAWSAKIRAQAFFSARVEQGHILDKLREVSDSFTRGEIGQAEARTILKEFLASEGYDPRRGGLGNLASTG